VEEYRRDKNTKLILVAKSQGKKFFGSSRCTLENDIKIYLNEIRWEAGKFIQIVLERDRLWAVVNTVINLQVT
jgi:hypothetical protein